MGLGPLHPGREGREGNGGKDGGGRVGKGRGRKGRGVTEREEISIHSLKLVAPPMHDTLMARRTGVAHFPLQWRRDEGHQKVRRLADRKLNDLKEFGLGSRMRFRAILLRLLL